VSRPVADLPNLGAASARLLSSIGISTEDDLRRFGAVEAFARLRFEKEGGVSMNLLWALHGAVEGIDWRRIDPVTKGDLLARLRAGDGSRPR
jgi:DNA transformation protein and related proteins